MKEAHPVGCAFFLIFFQIIAFWRLTKASLSGVSTLYLVFFLFCFTMTGRYNPRLEEIHMPTIDPHASGKCVILPFHPKTLPTTKLQTTSLAALIAVTILHEPGVNAEDKLMEIIESSGEVEILDADETCADLYLEQMSGGRDIPSAVNDNAI